MAWNRPTVGKSDEARGRRKKSHFRRTIVATVSVLGTVIAAWWFWSSTETETSNPESSTSRIKEAGRERMKRIVEAKTGKPLAAPRLTQSDAKAVDPGWYTNKMGEVKRRSGRPQRIFYDSPNRSLFTSPAEEQLSGIVNTPLGSNYYDDDVPEDFDEQFAYSLTNRIVIADDDPPDVIEKKQRVIEAKETLVQLKNSGADLKQVLREEKERLKKRFEDYLFFEEGLNKLRAEEASPDEIAEYAMAAKQMMKEREIEAPLALDTDEVDAMEKIEKLIQGKNPDEETAEGKEE